MKKIYLLLPILLVLFAGAVYFMYFNKNGILNKLSKNEYQTLIEKNAQALEDEDLQAYMDTIHSNIDYLEEVEDGTQMILDRYDMDIEIESVKVVSKTDDEVIVEVVQTTKRIGGETDFKDNKVTATHTLKKDGSEWKIYSSEMKSIDYLK